jgi:predicted PurR-regulated permease PerM
MLHGPNRGTTEKGGFLVLLALVTVALLWIVQPFASALLFAGLAAIMFQPLFNHILVRRPEKRNSAAAATLLIITFAVIVPAVVLTSVVLEQAATIVVAFREGRIDPVKWLVQMRDSLPEFVRTLLARNGWDDIEALQTRAQTLLSESAGVIASYAVAIGGGALSLLLSVGVACTSRTSCCAMAGTSAGRSSWGCRWSAKSLIGWPNVSCRSCAPR